jgi:flagellar biosynthesis regulator FlaF
MSGEMNEAALPCTDEEQPALETANRFGQDSTACLDLPLIEQDARALIDAAIHLTEAETPVALGDALAHNLAIWVAVQMVASREDCGMPPEVRDNLIRLAQFVVRTTLGVKDGLLTERSLQTMAQINLNIADGLLRSQQNTLIRERAYEIWEEDGKPEGREADHWLRAEQEVLELLNANYPKS